MSEVLAFLLYNQFCYNLHTFVGKSILSRCGEKRQISGMVAHWWTLMLKPATLCGRIVICISALWSLGSPFMELLSQIPATTEKAPVHSYVWHHCEHFMECRTSDKVMTGKWLDVRSWWVSGVAIPPSSSQSLHLPWLVLMHLLLIFSMISRVQESFRKWSLTAQNIDTWHEGSCSRIVFIGQGQFLPPHYLAPYCKVG